MQVTGKGIPRHQAPNTALAEKSGGRRVDASELKPNRHGKRCQRVPCRACDSAGSAQRRNWQQPVHAHFKKHPDQVHVCRQSHFGPCRLTTNLQWWYSVSAFSKAWAYAWPQGRPQWGGQTCGGHIGHRPLSAGRTCSNLLFKSST